MSESGKRQCNDKAWDLETMKIPWELSVDVGRDAIVLYLYGLSFADEAGFCDRLYLAGARAGLKKPEMDAAIHQLVEHKYIEIVVFEDCYGDSKGCRFLHHSVPLRAERLAPNEWRAIRAEVFKRDAFTCQYCGVRGGDLECDHIEPISLGGTNEMGNLTTACARCNRKKRAKLLRVVA